MLIEKQKEYFYKAERILPQSRKNTSTKQKATSQKAFLSLEKARKQFATKPSKTMLNE
ncbi:MAG: hypothetical protein IJ219_08090 [Bacteroidaceae bacterium]|nr:hypothetical protein [Bacteroidaceae bacterium]